MKNRRFFAVVICVLAALPATAFAATFVVPQDRILLEKSPVVVTGSVLSSYASLSENGAIRTVTEISVEEVLKGRVNRAEILRLSVPGGAVGDAILAVSGMPQFETGDRVLLFLTNNRHGGWTPTDFVLGKFAFEVTGTGKQILVREEEEITGWDLQGKVHQERGRSADRFLAFLRKSAAGVAAPEDYWLDEPSAVQAAVEPGPIETLASSSPTDYAMIDGSRRGFRWATFPTTKSWVNTNTQSGAPEGGVTAIQAGLGAWTNDCGSNVSYAYTGSNGSATAGLVSSDGIHAVMFNDPNNEISGSYSCSTGGTLGIGGVFASGTNSFSGETFWSVIEGNVVIQDGLSCWSGLTDGRLNQLLTHELGHATGFRHSNDAGRTPNTTDAIMRSSLVQNFGAVLRQYDIDAVRVMYSGGSCVQPEGDLNLDSRSDLVWRQTANGQNAVWFMNGLSVSSSSLLPDLTDLNMAIAAVGDFNGDGRGDLFWRHAITGQNAVWLMNGASISGSGYLPTEADLNWKVVASGDTNADGRFDIIWRHAVTGQNAVWLMNGTSVSGTGLLTTVSDLNWQIGGAGDTNGDAKADLIWRNSATGDNAVWFLDGLSVSSTSLLNPISDLGWKVAAVGDTSGDAKSDIVWRHSITGQNAVWLIDGATVTGTAFLPTVSDLNFAIVAMGDLDADTKADLVWRHSTTGQNAGWLLNGLAVSSTAFLPTEPNTNWKIAGPK